MRKAVSLMKWKDQPNGLFWAACALSLVTIGSAQAHGHEIGNGGGAWVCYEQTGDIRSEMLVDTFEAQAQYGLKIAQYPGKATDIVDLIMLRVYRTDADLAAQIQQRLDAVNDLQPGSKITYTEDNLTVINDQGLHKVEPGPWRCRGGSIKYGQIVNFDDSDDTIIVQDVLLNSLTETDRAALIVHEAVYKYLRDQYGDQDSVRTRQVVGLLFSTLSQDDLKTQIETVLGGGINAIGMEFAHIKAGPFMMGSPTDESGRYDDEMQHLVQLTQDFEMQTTDVTQKQYYDVMGVNPSNFKNIENCAKAFQVVQGTTLCPNNPVESVSWDDAQAFIAKFNSTRHDGYFYRLPTEAEWEYAARGGTTTAYYFGDDANELPLYGWYSGNSGNMTHEVRQLKPNAYGLYDMVGNVWQWVQDFYGDYSSAGQVNPQGNPSGSYRAIRGGSWHAIAQYLRSAIRTYATPSYRNVNLGFRLVRTK